MQQTEVDSLYAFLAAAALWPVAAAVRGGDITGLMMIGVVLGRMGSPTLINGLQRWHDEAEAAQQLAATVAAEPELCAELDVILRTVDAFRLAREALPEGEHQWFVETLQTALTSPDNATHLTASLTGSGAIAQGPGAIGAGERGVAVGGDAIDNLIVTGTVIGNVYTGPPTRDPAEALAIYRGVLVAIATTCRCGGWTTMPATRLVVNSILTSRRSMSTCTRLRRYPWKKQTKRNANGTPVG